MSFTSPLFYVVLVPAAAAFYLHSGRRRAIYLLALSYGFYALSSRIYLVLLILASAGVYAIGLAIAKSGSERAKQAYMAAGVAVVVAVIVAFKAAGAGRGGNPNEMMPGNELQGAVCDPSPPAAGDLPITGSTYQTFPTGPG